MSFFGNHHDENVLWFATLRSKSATPAPPLVGNIYRNNLKKFKSIFIEKKDKFFKF